MERTMWFQTKGKGYLTEQSTQPQTLGYSLADSPVGLLAWIYEKLVLWTDDYKWSDDEGSCSMTFSAYCLRAFETVLTWISLYWFSRAGPAASLRIYFELAGIETRLGRSTIPMGASFFPKEVVMVPAACVSTNQLCPYETNISIGGCATRTKLFSSPITRQEAILLPPNDRKNLSMICGGCSARGVLPLQSSPEELDTLEQPAFACFSAFGGSPGLLELG